MGNANSSDTKRDHDDNNDTESPTIPTKQPSSDGKVYFSYSDVHETVNSLVPRLQKAKFEPNVIIAIGYVHTNGG